jgi:hypothetical protein
MVEFTESLAVQRLRKANVQAAQWRQDMALIPNRVMGKGKASWDVEFYDKNGQLRNRAEKGNRVLAPMSQFEAIKSKRIILEKKTPFHKPVKQAKESMTIGEKERWQKQCDILHMEGKI